MEFEVYSRVACRTLIFYTTAKNSGHVGYLWCDCDGGEKWEGRLCVNPGGSPMLVTVETAKPRAYWWIRHQRWPRQKK